MFPGHSHGMALSDHVVEYLNLDSAAMARLDSLAANDLLTVEPVALPEASLEAGWLLKEGAARHYGWPVAARFRDTEVVYFNIDWSGEGKPHPSPGAITVTTNQGRTWSRPLLLPVEEGEKNKRGPGMAAIGTTREGRFVLLCCAGLFTSTDPAKSWTPIACDQVPGAGCNTGPRIIDHPGLGWLLVAHSMGKGRPRQLCFFNSHDRGRTWSKRILQGGTSFSPAEPTILQWENHLGVVSRNHAGQGPSTGGYHRQWSAFVQYSSADSLGVESLEQLEIRQAVTNMQVRRMDTLDVIYNPVTNRLEAVVPVRNQGFPDQREPCQKLTLWSIEPGRFLDGKSDWRFECVLVRSPAFFARGFEPGMPSRDGMHPGASVVDEKAGVQHIYVFFGSRNHVAKTEGSTGIFRITRSLNTPQLAERANGLDGLTPDFAMETTFAERGEWVPTAAPVSWKIGEDRDVIRMDLPTLPTGTVQHGEAGLEFRATNAGYHGLYLPGALLLQNHRFEWKARVTQWPVKGTALGVGLSYGAQRVVFRLTSEGGWLETGPDRAREQLFIHAPDDQWHHWTLEVRDGIAAVTQDDQELGRGQVVINDSFGWADAPLALFVEPESEEGCRLEVAWLKGRSFPAA